MHVFECEVDILFAGAPLDYFRCLKAEEKPFHVLILSDLNQDNYFMEDRFEKLGLKHAEITLAKLAKFHAASVVYKERVRMNLTINYSIDRRSDVLMNPLSVPFRTRALASCWSESTSIPRWHSSSACSSKLTTATWQRPWRR